MSDPEIDTAGEPLEQDVPEPDVPVLTAPRDGLPVVDETGDELARTIAALAGGHGPVAVDAERAHGFRYSQRAYLLQLRRAGAGTHLIDPVAYGQPADLGTLRDAIADAEWVIHAANQDLPCLAEVNLVPRTLFDTELAARLLNYPRVALGTMLEELLGVRLLKEHSAADWSTRPIPHDWLNYAALDVELLVELRDALTARLAEAGKDEWARQEFAALVAGAGTRPPVREDPWRRTSGMHKVRTRRQLAYVAELWSTRDEIAREQDRAPGRVLADVAITELATAADPGAAALRRVPGFTRRQARRFDAEWLAALRRAARLPESQLPPMHRPSEGPPPPRMWQSKDPAAAARLAAAREALAQRAAEVELPAENLLTPDYLRRLAWRPPVPATAASIDATLEGFGARAWQRELTVPLLVDALAG
ncbi:HRDC domain-containing protein [Microlunatus ginsengisoli]|uniref:HRDC domain-containing protein n=1 Tax=Microlunatus ginsengisoli TaxID=363863 RepID=UPI0031D2A51B